MTIQGVRPEDRFEATSREILDRFGVSLTLGSDFRIYRKLLRLGRPDHVVGAPFDPDLHDLDRDNARWIIGHDENGAVIHCQALRVLDMGRQSLAEHFRNGFRLFPPSGLDIDLARSRYRPGPSARRMRGTVVYHGEVWMGGDKGQFRGSGLSGLLGRFAFLTALRAWNPDHVIGFMPNIVANKGFVTRQGYMHAEPYAVRWFVKGEDTPLEGYMVHMGRDDIEFVLDLPESEIRRLAA